jgi:hypothetical protein
MKARIRNNLTDILALLIYHALFLGGTVMLLKLDAQDTQQRMPELKAKPVALTTGAFRIKEITGQAVLSKTKAVAPRPAVIEDELVQASRLETAQHSFLLLQFGQYDEFQLRLEADSKISVDELHSVDGGKTLISLHLARGKALLKVSDISQRVQVQLRILGASHASTNGEFMALTDGKNYSLLMVNEGVVKSRLFHSHADRELPAGFSLWLDATGKEKLESNSELLQKFDWQLDSSIPQDKVTLDQELGRVFPVVKTTPVPSPDAIRRMDQLKKELINFEQYNESLQQEIEREKILVDRFKQKIASEKNEVLQDINCIEKSKSECRLFSEKVLLKRGFPRNFGDQRYRKSMAQSLQAYLVERQQELQSWHRKIGDWQQLLMRRQQLLAWARHESKQDAEPEAILRKLQDPQLIKN